jgi:hypothetical protein
VAAVEIQQQVAQALELQVKDFQEEQVFIILTLQHILLVVVVAQVVQVLTEQPLRVVVVELV